MNTISNLFNKYIHEEGHSIIIFCCLLTIITFFVSSVLFIVCLFLSFACMFFFRDPERVIPDVENIIVSPADGIIQNIIDDKMPQELGHSNKTKRISIFLNITDIHVNRIPITGNIVKLSYRPGKFFNASLDKSSIYNERQSILLQTKEHHYIGISQIAGFIARRIVCNLQKNQSVSTGERFGIIKFGSRVDTYIPAQYDIKVKIGQTMIAGETVIASIK